MLNFGKEIWQKHKLMIPMPAKNNTIERGVKAYLPPLYHRYFQAYVKYIDESESRSATHMIKKFFDDMPQQEKQKILQLSKNSY